MDFVTSKLKYDGQQGMNEFECDVKQEHLQETKQATFTCKQLYV